MKTDSDDDYMSEKILNDKGSNERDVAPRRKRDLEVYKKRVRTNDSKSKIGIIQRSEDRLKETESKKISADNIGYKILTKMGFKDGEGLGRSAAGIIEPISVPIQKDRAGVGKTVKKVDWNLNEREFTKSIRYSTKEKEIRNDLLKIQRVCYDLDCRNNVKNSNDFFWPSISTEDETSLEKLVNQDVKRFDDSFENIQKLIDQIHEYLKDQYLYCFWCGIVFDNSEDLRTFCPGKSKEDHDVM